MSKVSTELKRRRVAVLITDSDKLLLVYRNKNGRSYYVIPGGGIEPGETVEQASLREIKEETGLDIVLGNKLWTYNNEDQLEYYYLATSFAGTLSLGGPELQKQSSENTYRLEWIPRAELKTIPLVPESVKVKVIKVLFEIKE